LRGVGADAQRHDSGRRDGDHGRIADQTGEATRRLADQIASKGHRPGFRADGRHKPQVFIAPESQRKIDPAVAGESVPHPTLRE